MRIVHDERIIHDEGIDGLVRSSIVNLDIIFAYRIGL
jgi:hypothetical protein